jgi:hypothetical protein
VAPPLIVAPEPVPTTSVATPPPAAAVPVEITPSMPSTPPAPAISTTPAGVLPAVAAPPPAATAAPESVIIDPKPRIVTREGYVRKALNIQAPSDYELRDLNSGETIEYLQPAAQDKDFKKYTGAKVSVSGTEWLDQRWPKTPILRIQTVDPMP